MFDIAKFVFGAIGSAGDLFGSILDGAVFRPQPQHGPGRRDWWHGVTLTGREFRDTSEPNTRQRGRAHARSMAKLASRNQRIHARKSAIASRRTVKTKDVVRMARAA